MLIIWGMKVATQKDSLKDFYKVEKERKVMRANEKLGNVVKIGYLERPTKKEKVAPELPTLHLDMTDYREPSVKRALKNVYNESKAHRKERPSRYGTSFMEGFFNGFRDVFGWLFKGFIFLVFAYFGYWILEKIF